MFSSYTHYTLCTRKFKLSQDYLSVSIVVLNNQLKNKFFSLNLVLIKYHILNLFIRVI